MLTSCNPMMDLFFTSLRNFSCTLDNRVVASKFFGSHAVKYVGSARCDESTLYVVTRIGVPPVVRLCADAAAVVVGPGVIDRVVAGIFVGTFKKSFFPATPLLEEDRNDDETTGIRRNAIDAARI